MGKKDTVLKDYLSKPEIFADLFNGFLFEGKQVLTKEKITPADSTATVLVQDKEGKTLPVQKYRDVICKAALGMEFVVLGVENQMNVHYAMPLRSMLYDALSYTEQAMEINRHHKAEKKLRGDEYLSGFRKQDKLIPTVTIVVYYGEREWDAGTELFDILDLEENGELLKPYLSNYKMNLLKVNEAENLERYQTGLRELFGIVKYQQDIEQLQEYMKKNRERYQNLDEATYQAIQNMTSVDELMSIDDEEGGKRNMMRAFEQLKEQYINIGRERGIAEGEARGITKGIAEGEARGITKGVAEGEAKGILQTMKEYGSTKENAIKKVMIRFPENRDIILKLADEIFIDP